MYYTLLSLESVKEMGNQPTMHLHISEYKNSIFVGENVPIISIGAELIYESKIKLGM